MSDKIENNYRLGRMYYQMLTDAEGYPNGMPYWSDLSANDKYYFCMCGLSMLDIAIKDKFVSPVKEFGFVTGSVYGEGDCKELMDLIESKLEEEKKQFEERVKSFQTKEEK